MSVSLASRPTRTRHAIATASTCRDGCGKVKLTAVQCAQALFDARPNADTDTIVTLTAIAGAESCGYHLDAIGDHCSSFGPWQEHTLPDKRQAATSLSKAAELAWEKYDAQGFGAWSAYNNGTYAAYLIRAAAALTKVRPHVGGAPPVRTDPPPPRMKNGECVETVGGCQSKCAAIYDSGQAEVSFIPRDQWIAKCKQDCASDPCHSKSNLPALDAFLGLLTRGSTWIRVAEVVGGIVAIFLAIAMLAKRVR